MTTDDNEKKGVGGYSYLNTFLSHEDLVNNFEYVYSCAEYMIERIVKDSQSKLTQDHFFINCELIEQVLVDAYADLHRLMEFHNIKVINCIKRAAYLSAWIHRRKPIQIIKEIEEDFLVENYRVLAMNETLANFVARSIPFEVINPTTEKSSEHINFAKHFNYFLRYRHVTPQAIEMALLGLSCSMNVSAKQ